MVVGVGGEEIELWSVEMERGYSSQIKWGSGGWGGGGIPGK